MLVCVLEPGFHQLGVSIVDEDLMRRERGYRHFYSFLPSA